MHSTTWGIFFIEVLVGRYGKRVLASGRCSSEVDPLPADVVMPESPEAKKYQDTVPGRPCRQKSLWTPASASGATPRGDPERP